MFPSQETTYDSKYVASILSSMASGDSSASNSYQMPNFLTSMATGGNGTTPTLTPTTLANLEQTFIELQSVPVDGSGSANGGCESHTQSGFVPPVVDMSSREQSMDSFCSDPEWEPGMKRGRDEDGELIMDGSQSGGPQRKYTRRSRNEKLTPEEDQRRRVRRERNKLAAAKCRQRRVDHTNSLVEETEKLEAEKSDLESEIQSLQQEKDQLEFLLQAHVPICKVDAHSSFKVKTEPLDPTLMTSTAARSSQSHLSYSASSSCSSMHSSSSNSMSSSRPSSLALQDRGSGGELPVIVSCAPIPLSTPSSGLFTYTSLDSLVEGSTGLTPLTEGHGALGSTGLTPLTASGGTGVSCASQMQRSESEGGSDAVSSPTLVSL